MDLKRLWLKIYQQMFEQSWWSRGHEFRRLVMTGQVVHTLVPVTNQYNLVLAKRWWCSLAGKVTAGLAESNGSLPPGSWLVTYGLTAKRPGSSPDPTLVNSSMGLPLHRDRQAKRNKYVSEGDPYYKVIKVQNTYMTLPMWNSAIYLLLKL